MSMPYFCGALSGSNLKAYYIIGYQNDFCMYLDPHYVQPSLKTHSDLIDNKIF